MTYGATWMGCYKILFIFLKLMKSECSKAVFANETGAICFVVCKHSNRGQRNLIVDGWIAYLFGFKKHCLHYEFCGKSIFNELIGMVSLLESQFF